MSIKLEESSRKDVKHASLMDKWNKYTISLAIGCFLGLVIFLLANPIYTLSYSGAEVKNVVADCKASVVKFVPLGAYPEGSDQVVAALNYCGTLG
jgi:Na+-driven multidrug efflux pump